MADNVVLNSGSGGSTAAADDVGGVLHQRVKVSVGADGTANDAVPVSNGLDTTATGVLAAGLVAQVDDTSPSTVTENQFGPVRMSSRRALLVEGVTSGTAIPVSDNGGSLTVDGTVAVSGTVTVDGSGVTQPVSHAGLTALNGAISGTEVQVDVVSSALPSGAATAANQSTSNTALSAIQTAVETLDNAVRAEDEASAGGHSGLVVLARRTDTPGAQSGTDGDYEFLQVTGGRLATQTTVSGTVTVDGSGVTQPISHAALTELAAAIDTELQVDIVGALPAGTNAIGKLAANSGVDIGDVDVTSLPATVHSADYDTGAGTDTTLAFGVAVPAAGGAAVITGDTANGLDVDVTRVSGTVTVDGSGVTQPISHAALTELAAAINGSSQLDVNIAASNATLTVAAHAVTNAGTFAVQESGAALTALQLLDDAVKTDDAAFTPATDKVLMLGAQADETAPDSVDEGDAGALRMTLARGLHVNVRDDAGDSCMDGTNNALRVNIVAGAAAGGTSATDEAAYTPTASAGTPVMGAADETSPDAAAEGTLAIIRSTLNRALHVNLRDASGNELSVGGGTQYDEDTAHVSGDKLTMAGAVRNDAGTALAADGDRTVLQVDNTGALRVAGGGGGTQYTEDAAAAADPVGNAVILVRKDTLAALTSADGDNVAARGTDKGELYVKHVDSLPVTDNGGSLTVDGTVAATQSGTWNVTDVSGTVSLPTGASTLAEQQTQTTALQLLDNIVRSEDEASGDGHAGAVVLAKRADTPGNTSGTDGDYEPLQVAGGRLHTSAAQSGTWNVTLAAGTNTNEVVGDAAHDAAIAGNPVRIAGRALTSDYTAVAAGDTADLIATLLGKLVTIDYANPANTWSYAAASGGITNTTGVTAKAASGAGVRNYITRVQVINGHATVSTDVQIRDGAAGTVLWRGFAQAAGGGVTTVFDPPLRGTANTLVEVANGTTGSATYFNLQGFTAAE
jgi:hypothetical protein